MQQNIVESSSSFELDIFEEKEIISKSDYYFLQDNGKIVLKHDKLLQLAEKHKVVVEKTILEYGVYTNKDNFYFVHRSFGTTRDGVTVDEVGDASPINCNSLISKGIPAIMSDKRSKDRLLIRLLGIKDRVYSDSEFETTKTKSTKPTLIDSLKNAPHDERLRMAESAILNYGAFKNANITMKDAMNLYIKRENDAFAFLVSMDVKTRYPNGNEKMEYLHLCARILHKEYNEYIQTSTGKYKEEVPA